MNDFLLLKSIGEGITELKSKYRAAPDSEKEEISFEIERLFDDYKYLYQLSLKKSLIVTDEDVAEMERLKKEIDNCATGAEILETIKSAILWLLNVVKKIL